MCQPSERPGQLCFLDRLHFRSCPRWVLAFQDWVPIWERSPPRLLEAENISSKASPTNREKGHLSLQMPPQLWVFGAREALVRVTLSEVLLQT